MLGGKSFKELADDQAGLSGIGRSGSENCEVAEDIGRTGSDRSEATALGRVDSQVPAPLYRLKQAGLVPSKQEEKLIKLHNDENNERDRLEEEENSGCTVCQRAWLYPDLPWGAPPKWGKHHTIYRGVAFLKVWDILLFVGLMYVAFSVPYQVGFNNEDGRSQCVFDVRDSTGITFAVLDATADTIFTIDIILNFVQARWVVSAVGTPHWELVNDLPTIRSMYLRGSFVSDLIGQIPWQYMDCIFSNVDTKLKMLRLLRLFKLFRLHRITRMIQALKRKFPTSELLVTSLELLLTMCVVAHWMCCLWFSVGYPDGWVYEEGITYHKDSSGSELYNAESDFHEWITSFYWAITTMSTIGYGDIVATTTTERAVASIVMVLGCGFFAWATGRLTNILTKKSICSEKFEEKMGELNEYFLNRGISERMVDKVKSFYMLKFPTLRMFDEGKILLDLPTELSKELLVELYDDVIALSPLFGVFSKAVQKELCYRIKPKFVEAGTVICEEGQHANAMYIIRFGYVQISSRGEELMTAQRGDLFGENELVGLSLEQHRRRTAKAVTICDLCVITADDWWELISKYPEMGKTLSMMTKKIVRELEKRLENGESLSTKQLTCPEWSMAAEYVEALMASAAQREVASASQVPGAQLPLRTWFKLHLKQMVFARHQAIPRSQIFVVVVCQDENGQVGAVGESRVFPVSAEGAEGAEAVVDEKLKVLLFHRHNTWETMKGLQVTIYAAPVDRMFSDEQSGTFYNQFGDLDEPKVAKQVRRQSLQSIEEITGVGMTMEARRLQERQGREHAKNTRGGLKHVFSTRSDPSKHQHSSRKKTEKFEGCMVLWEGSVPLAPLIQKRDQDSYMHQIELRPASVVKAKWQPTSPLTVGIQAEVVRVLRQDSKWYSVLPALAAKGYSLGSAYFEEQRRQRVKTMRRSVNHFGKVTSRVKEVEFMLRHHNYQENHPALAGHKDYLAQKEMRYHIQHSIDTAVSGLATTLRGDHASPTMHPTVRHVSVTGTSPLEAHRNSFVGSRRSSAHSHPDGGSYKTLAWMRLQPQQDKDHDQSEAKATISGTGLTAMPSRDVHGLEVMESFQQVVDRAREVYTEDDAERLSGNGSPGREPGGAPWGAEESSSTLERVVHEQQRQRRQQEKMLAAQHQVEDQVRALRGAVDEVAHMLRSLLADRRPAHISPGVVAVSERNHLHRPPGAGPAHADGASTSMQQPHTAATRVESIEVSQAQAPNPEVHVGSDDDFGTPRSLLEQCQDPSAESGIRRRA